MWTTLDYDGADGWDSYIIYPGGVPIRANPDVYPLTRQWNDHTRKAGTYFMSTDWVGPDDVMYPHAMSYMFRSYDYAYPPVFDGTSRTGSGPMAFVWPLGMIRDLRWSRPNVVVGDGYYNLEVDFEGPMGESAAFSGYGNDMRPPFTVAPNLVTEMASEAQERPDDYRDLVVRVAGYSARFTALSTATQDEIIAVRWRIRLLLSHRG